MGYARRSVAFCGVGRSCGFETDGRLESPGDTPAQSIVKCLNKLIARLNRDTVELLQVFAKSLEIEERPYSQKDV